jgi:hypothetical protein
MQRTPIPALVVATALAALVGGDASAEPRTNGATASTPQKSASTGIAECDTYFEMVDACVATKKMTKEEQQAAEFSVSRLRTMVPIARSPQGRATLVDRCRQSLEAARKNDKHSCYKPLTSSSGRGR